MRLPLVILVGLYGAFASATPELFLKCKTSVALDGPPKSLSVDIFKDGAKHTAVQKDDYGQVTLPVEVTEAGVRENLSPEMVDENLNLAEQMVAFAMAIESDEITKGSMKSGVDLKAVRSAKVFDIDPKRGQLGKAAIVEAKDAQGRSIGNFLSGLLLGPCE